jgi:hypothetical protein
LNYQAKVGYGKDKQRRPIPAVCKKALAVVAEAARANLTSYQGACQVFFAALLWSLGSQFLLKFSFSSS